MKIGQAKCEWCGYKTTTKGIIDHYKVCDKKPKGETTKGAGEIPKHIQEWIENAVKVHKQDGGLLVEFYHHLTTSSPSNSALKSAHEILSTKKQHAFQSGYYHFGVVIEAMKEFAEQSQPQLVSGVRTREDILESNNIKSNEDVNPKYWPYYYSQILNAMEEYKNQFHPTQPELKVKEDVNTSGQELRASSVASQSPVGSSLDLARIASLIHAKVNALDLEDAEGHSWWNRIKEFIMSEVLGCAKCNECGGYGAVNAEILVPVCCNKPNRDGSCCGNPAPGVDYEPQPCSMCGTIGWIQPNKEQGAQECDASKADQGTVSREHHPTQEIKGVGKREAIELLRDSFKSELFELHLTKGLEKRADKAFKIIGKLESILLNGLEGKGREDLLAGGRNSDSDSQATLHSSAPLDEAKIYRCVDCGKIINEDETFCSECASA